jgi:tRNA (guanine37-N1)-methyltransferase
LGLFIVFLNKLTRMRIDILTVLPELLVSPLNNSIVKRARDKGLVEINLINLRDFAKDKYRSVDDYAFGGGAGMVMMIEPVYRAIEKLKSERDYDEIIYASPDGEKFTQKTANLLSLSKNIIILAGHYKGVDQRIRDHLITREISIGDYVLSGGEIPAAVIIDAIVRLIPGALSDEQSALSDSFQDDLLAPPVYTRPAEFMGWKVPDVLLSGHAAEIEKWRHEQSVERTAKLRPDLSEE